MTGDFYHPLKYLTKLEYLDLSFSNFSNDSVYLSNKKTLFDNLTHLKYLNLRETNIENPSFLSSIKQEGILLNFMDNQIALNLNKHNNILLVTKIMLKDNSILDISKYLGN